MGNYRERVGTLTVGSDTYQLRLAAGRAMPYQPSFALVTPSESEIPGQSFRYSPDPTVRIWQIDDWTAGEGFDPWVPKQGGYSFSESVRPHAFLNAVELGGYPSVGVKADDSAFSDAAAFGQGIGQLWAGYDTTIHALDTSNGKWSTAGWSVGSAGTYITSIADGDDGLNMFVGHTDDQIYKVPVAGGASHNNQFTNPVICSFQGVLYGLDGNWLYSVNKTLANTRTSLSEPAGSSATYLASSNPYRRLSVSDKGPIWYQRLDNGQTIIWEYNQATDTDSRVGMLPVDHAWPYSILWAHGYIFVGFRYAAGDGLSGDAYLYYQRGGQRGIAGPIRYGPPNNSGATPSLRVLLAGTIGDLLMFDYAGHLWGYNLSSGGLHVVAATAFSTASSPRDAVTFGKDVFVSGTYSAVANKALRVQTDLYSQSADYIASGRYDFGLPGIDKCLLDVTVTTLPLPANTQITCKVSIEGATATALTGTFNTATATSYTWTASTAAASLVGRDFEIYLYPLSTSTAATPTIRSVTARAIPIERQRIWRLELDTGTWHSQSAGSQPRSSDVLADLRAIGESNQLVTFTNPWEGEEQDAPTSYTVIPSQLTYVEAEGPGMIGVLELKEAAYV